MSRTECLAVLGSCSLGEFLRQCPALLPLRAVPDWQTSQSLDSKLVHSTGMTWDKPQICWLDAAVMISAAIDPGHTL